MIEMLEIDLAGDSVFLESSQNGECETQSTQPTSEELVKSSIQGDASDKSKRAKKQWGPSWLRKKQEGS